jgi:hypothetical protein
MFEQELDYGIARNRDMLRDAERRRTGVYEDWHLFNVQEAVRRAFERIGRWYARKDEPCLTLSPACEML